jgi:hypothetical protein
MPPSSCYRRVLGSAGVRYCSDLLGLRAPRTGSLSVAERAPYERRWQGGLHVLPARKIVPTDRSPVIHLAAILQHPHITCFKPKANLKYLRNAIEANPSIYIELSEKGDFVRRRPSTYPLPNMKDFPEVDEDHKLVFWDKRTLYVEPHRRGLGKYSAKIAHWLQTRSELSHHLPVQAVIPMYPHCAFVVLSEDVTNLDAGEGWIESMAAAEWKGMFRALTASKSQR